MHIPSIRLPPLTTLLGIVLALVLLALLLRPSETATRLVTRWSPEPVLTKPELPPAVANQVTPVPIAGAVAAVDAFDLHVDDGLYPDQRAVLAAELNDVFAYVKTRFGGEPTGRFTVSMVNAADCGLHGIAYTDVRNVQVFTCANMPSNRAVNILAHEMVHQLEQDRYGPAHLRADLILSEGTATWGAGKYWLGSQPDFRSFARLQRQNGPFYPLATHYNGLGIAGMNALYYEWASFVDYLISTYGRDQFDKLYVSGNSAPGSADYAGVYGKDLPMLEQEWLRWLDG